MILLAGYTQSPSKTIRAKSSVPVSASSKYGIGSSDDMRQSPSAQSRVQVLLENLKVDFSHRVLGEVPSKGQHIFAVINHDPLTLLGGALKMALPANTQLLVMPFFDNTLASLASYTTGDDAEPIDTLKIKHYTNSEAISIKAINRALENECSIMFYPYGKSEALRHNLAGSRQTLTEGPVTAARTSLRHQVPIVPVVEMVSGGFHVPQGIDNNACLRAIYKSSGCVTRYCGLPGLVPCILATMRDAQGVSLAKHFCHIYSQAIYHWLCQRGGKLPVDVRAIKLHYQPSFHLVGEPISPDGFNESHYKKFDQKVRLQLDALLVIAHLIQPIYTQHCRSEYQMQRLHQLIAVLKKMTPEKLLALRDVLHADLHKQNNPLQDVQQVLHDAFNEQDAVALSVTQLNRILAPSDRVVAESMKRD